MTNVLSRLARYFRSPAYLLMGLVLSMSVAGVWLLVTNVAQIRASLPIEVLHRDRELAGLLYEVSRLEALLDRVRLGDTEIDNQDLRRAVGDVRNRLQGHPSTFGGELGREIESLQRRIHTTLAALDATLRGVVSENGKNRTLSTAKKLVMDRHATVAGRACPLLSCP